MKRIAYTAALALLALAATMFVSPAPASAEMRYTGVYFGVGAGYQVGATEAGVSAQPYGDLLNLDGLASRGCALGVHGGADWKFANSPLLIGVYGEWSPEMGCKAEFSLTVPAANFSLVHAEIGNDMKLGVRVGYVTPANVLFYAGVHYARAEMEWSLANAALTGTDKLSGKGAVLGFEYPVNDWLSLGAQYSYTTYDAEVHNLFGPVNLSLNTDVHAVMVRGTIRPQLFGQPVQAATLK